MNKAELRKLMLEKRLSLSSEEMEADSRIISEKISSLSSFISAGTVLFYYPFRREVDIRGLMTQSLKDKTVCLPRIEKTEGEMTARRITDLNDLSEGEYGIYSPDENAQIITPDKIDFVVVPLVAFDENLHRTGYGGGYYDRYLPKCVNAVKCGAAYSFQKTDKIKCGPHDIKLDMIVTEV